jgi:hypothetical protein
VAERADGEQFIGDLYAGILRRQPSPKELRLWADTLEAGLASGRSHQDVVRKFVTSPEFRERTRVVPFFRDGHVHSPVVDPASLRGYPARNRLRTAADLPGLRLSVEAMASLWTRMLPLIESTPFSETDDGVHRFSYDNGLYPAGDAVILRAMILHYRPGQIIEVGCGAASACMLDVADEGSIPRFALTCIDRDTERVGRMIRPDDQVEILESAVQEVPPERFAALRAGDILFIDSSHVLKTGSDVHYALFYVLPVLQPGVIVHLHDVPFPFEYPELWIERNHSWNEAYAVQAFLMYNREFSILFWNSMLGVMRRDLLAAACPRMARNAGSSLWIVRN